MDINLSCSVLGMPWEVNYQACRFLETSFGPRKLQVPWAAAANVIRKISEEDLLRIASTRYDKA